MFTPNNPMPRGGLKRPPSLDANLDVSGMVDPDGGLIDRRIFSDTAVYRQEMRRIFARSWLFIAHEDQFKKPGDFFQTYMGEDPVIAVLNKKREIRVLLNNCRHRGARVCRADMGSTKNFTCTYHGWSFDLDGNLANVPAQEAYGDSFNPKDWGLVAAPRVESYKGLIFANWDEHAEPLEETLGDMRWYIDAFMDRDPEGTCVVGGVTKWVLDGNWKLAAEQFATDWYHVNMSHASALMVMSPTGKGPKKEIAMRTGRQYSDEYGNGAGFPVHPRNRFDAQPVHEYYDYDFLRERLSPEQVMGPLTNGHATVFPNFSYLPVNGSIRVWHPKGPNKMEVWSWTVLDKSMPEDVRHAQRLYNLRTFGPSGIFEQDDGENWSECQANAHAFMVGNTALNYQMGLGDYREEPGFPGMTSGLYSDAAGRAVYRRWRELMGTPAWHELRESADTIDSCHTASEKGHCHG
ncbi:3-phenylpropionate/cinnamic acid dioxygenase subunit alpha [Corynebacterium felinum]|uniref:3-phenylpropionate/trans-cinnamate dioxygenase alpha subunit n=2 Tax=Corynebacterium felinum TaxID=131318 RepID=A0ABU2B6H3_9CORY|nr:3-phenylpropionate/trans-cinnamate dioxygenase alpha subunit [Corynebacterium felinum]WJY96374.1 3-phenylpropionate/cinnamic acid dioxygenase subunit alpha [Corynebacterium felinum]